MKQRLLVMNGQKIIQSEEAEGRWVTAKVEKAGDLKAGIYSLHTAKPPDKSKLHEGVILHADSSRVYQLVGKQQVVGHNRSDFAKIPDAGRPVSIGYDGQGKAAVSVVSAETKLSRGRGFSR